MSDARLDVRLQSKSYHRRWAKLVALPVLILASHPAIADALTADLMRTYRTQTSVVRGSELCRPTEGTDEIVVCAQRSEDEAYRLPPQARGPVPGSRTVRSVSAERNALFDYDAGGIGSCSTVGPGGGTGCTLRSIKRARDD